MTQPPVCDYEGSDYQTSFWDKGGREYEDQTEAIALRRLLPKQGHLLLELGAGAGRNTPRYTGFDQIVLLDFSRTQLEQAQARLGQSLRYVYVAADAYRLPFVEGLFDTATMIRTLHHMAEAPKVLEQVRSVLKNKGVFILEFANKLNIKAILRYLLKRQTWSPFSREPVEFVKLNFDFHPKAVREWLQQLDFRIERTLALSFFRVGFLKRLVPNALLVFLDSLLQWTGNLWQVTPSIFVRARVNHTTISSRSAGPVISFFKCPACGTTPLQQRASFLECSGCGSKWEVRDGIYDFRKPIEE